MIVVDSTVLIKCFLPEIYSEDCSRLLFSGLEIATPEVALSQIGGSLWKRTRTGEVRPEEAKRIMRGLAQLPILYEPIGPLSVQAMELSSFSTRTFNESLYFSLAMRRQTRLISADHRWCSFLGTGKLKSYIEFIVDANQRLGIAPAES